MSERPKYPQTNTSDPNFKREGGITIREHFAGLAMSGLLANPALEETRGELIENAVFYADVLLLALAKDRK